MQRPCCAIQDLASINTRYTSEYPFDDDLTWPVAHEGWSGEESTAAGPDGA